MDTGDLESMKETLEEYPDDYLSLHFIDEVEDEDGSAAEKAKLNGVPHINYTVLHSAVKSGNLAAVQYLNKEFKINRNVLYVSHNNITKLQK